MRKWRGARGPGPCSRAHTHLAGIYSDESTVSLWYVTVGRTCVERYADVHLAPRTVVVMAERETSRVEDEGVSFCSTGYIPRLSKLRCGAGGS